MPSVKRTVGNAVLVMAVMATCIVLWNSRSTDIQLPSWPQTPSFNKPFDTSTDTISQITHAFDFADDTKSEAHIPVPDERPPSDAPQALFTPPNEDTPSKDTTSLPPPYTPFHSLSPEPFPKLIWQTSSPTTQLEYINKTQTWTSLNPSYTYTHLNDTAALSFVQEHFSHRPSISSFYASLPTPVVKADFLRYLLMLSQGGVYSDIDTSCLLPIDDWLTSYLPAATTDIISTSTTSPTSTSTSQDYSNINAVVAIEYADTTYPMFVRPISFIQWTLYSKPNHPIYERAVERVVSNLEYIARRQRVGVREVKLEKMDVLEATGPGMLSDVVMEYLRDVEAGQGVEGKEGEAVDSGRRVSDDDEEDFRRRRRAAEELPAEGAPTNGKPAEEEQIEAKPKEEGSRREQLAKDPEEVNQAEEISWTTFKDMKEPRVIGDVLVLPINAFGSGQKHSHSGQNGWGTALVRHHFGRSWYKRPG